MIAPTSTLRSLLLPKEHGSWSLALEPLALMLLVAPTAAGAALALAATAGFFARRPLKLATTLPAEDPRRRPAGRWALGLGLFAGLALVGAAGLGSLRALWPLLLAAPCGGLFLWFDRRHALREAEAELAGSTAFALLPAAGATLAGWPAPAALALAALALGRSLPTVLTVRAYLRLGKGQPADLRSPLAAATAAAALTGLLAQHHLVPVAAVAVSVLLGLRTGWLVGPFRPAWPARQVGFLEAGLGVVQLGLLAAAYHRW